MNDADDDFGMSPRMQWGLRFRDGYILPMNDEDEARAHIQQDQDKQREAPEIVSRVIEYGSWETPPVRTTEGRQTD